MQYLMMPLDAHYDLGFGAIAEAFRSSAMKLKEANPEPAFFDHLPLSFLHRHASELFLKSEIVILHRRLRLPYGTEPYNATPMVSVNRGWKPIYNVHSIAVLYAYWKALITPRTEELRDMCKCKPDWTIQPEADEWVRIIEAVDPHSTYSRYPSVRDPLEDKAKSPFKEMTSEKLFPPDRSPERKIMALIIENADGDFVRAYANEKGVEPNGTYMNALEQLNEMLFNYHAMMRFELTGGF
jgi:hypothetical protein